MKDVIKVVLIGNPNTGKSSIFNALTGLRQSVVNYPGATVEKKKGTFGLSEDVEVQILDLPGTYSLNASSLDDLISIQVLINTSSAEFPDVAIVVADVENLKRNLLLFTQIKELTIPTILVINMADLIKKNAITLDIKALEKRLNTKIVMVSTRKNMGLEELKIHILNYKTLPKESCTDISTLDSPYFEALKQTSPKEPLYKTWLCTTQAVNFSKKPTFLEVNSTKTLEKETFSQIKYLQQKETVMRYVFIRNALKDTYSKDKTHSRDLRFRLDSLLTHPVYGYLIFFMLLFFMFQAIYNWSTYPMDLIDYGVTQLGSALRVLLPEGLFSQLLTDGIIPGIGGVVVFIPQIAFLFLFVSILEETGYMSRLVFLMDKIMRRYGLSGKSVISMISGTACAVPAIMSTRNIENTRERLISILVTPFIMCSARLPVYLILITLVIPEKTYFGIGLQGLALFGLYFLGFVAALGSAYILSKTLKKEDQTIFVIEMPNYKIPMLKNVLLIILEKTKGFVWGAGKIILAVAMVLWFLASHGPSGFSKIETTMQSSPENKALPQEVLDAKIASTKLENSYIGIMGKALEPALSPLGYNWKVDIAILSSFLAREVFVGTLSVIYKANSDDQTSIKNRMAEDTNIRTGKPLFNTASGLSLMLFYAFSMQCVSALAITRKETNSFKWPVLQFVLMTILAYVSALLVYQILK